LMIGRAHHCRYAVFKVRPGRPAPAGAPRELRTRRGAVRANAAGPSGSPRPSRPRSRVGPRACALPQSRTARHPRRRAPTTNPFRACASGALLRVHQVESTFVSGLLPTPRGRGSSTTAATRTGPEPWRR
jgi:hypothetical protein